MTIVAGILTFEPDRTGRRELLNRTIASMRTAFGQVIVFDNSPERDVSPSTPEGAAERYFHIPVDERLNRTPGAGRNAMVDVLLRTDASIFVLSDDDMLWHFNAAERLEEMWAHMPEDIALVSGLLEPVWNWNTPRGTVRAGTEKILWRDSAPGAAWTFHRNRAETIFPVVNAFGYDYTRCCELRKDGRRVAQTDLADHIGAEKSTHGNRSFDQGKPLDRERWGV